ncbi:MAG: hypothetical protein EBW54_12740, partial [Betaproteobacteria bacterium]|nr:hypothetical protein [Betaproteobacteria bacterium]
MSTMQRLSFFLPYLLVLVPLAAPLKVLGQSLQTRTENAYAQLAQSPSTANNTAQPATQPTLPQPAPNPQSGQNQQPSASPQPPASSQSPNPQPLGSGSAAASSATKGSIQRLSGDRLQL